MRPSFFILARNEAINQWLNENPLVLGFIAIGLGVLIGGWGIYELSTGVATSKWGTKFSGSTASLLSGVRILVGVGAILFGVYKMIAG